MLLGDEEKARARNRLVDALKPASKPQPLPPPKTRRVSTPVQPGRARQWPTIAAAIVAILGGAYGGYQFTHWQSVDSGNVDAESKRRAEADKIRKQEEEAKRQADTEKLRKQLEDAKRQADAESCASSRRMPNARPTPTGCASSRRRTPSARPRPTGCASSRRRTPNVRPTPRGCANSRRTTPSARPTPRGCASNRRRPSARPRPRGYASNRRSAKRQADAERLRKQQGRGQAPGRRREAA